MLTHLECQLLTRKLQEEARAAWGVERHGDLMVHFVVGFGEVDAPAGWGGRFLSLLLAYQRVWLRWP